MVSSATRRLAPLSYRKLFVPATYQFHKEANPFVAQISNSPWTGPSKNCRKPKPLIHISYIVDLIETTNLLRHI